MSHEIHSDIQLNNQAAPTTPASGKVRVYAKAGKLTVLDDTGTETALGSGGGGGGGNMTGVNTSKITVSDTAPVSPSAGDMWLDTSSLVSPGFLNIDPQVAYEAHNDFLNTSTDSNTNYTNSGTGAGSGMVAIGALGVRAAGVIKSNTGTTATGMCGFNSPQFSGLNLAQMNLLWRHRFNIPLLSTSTNRFVAKSGFQNNIATTDGTNALYVKYTDTVNGGNFTFCTRDNGTETAVDTGVTVDVNKFYTVVISASSTLATCQIYDTTSNVGVATLLATVTSSTNLPQGINRDLGYVGYAYKTVGTTTGYGIQSDYFQVKAFFAGDR